MAGKIERVICFKSWTRAALAHLIMARRMLSKVVRKLDQLANHADGLRARVGMDVAYSPFRLRVPCSKIVVPQTTG